MPWRAALLAGSVTSCAVGLIGVAVGSSSAQGPYVADTLAKELGRSSVRTMGCLDFGLAIVEVHGDRLLDMHVGNRCTHPETLDLRKLEIRASRTVTISDPRREIAYLHVGGGNRGRERLRLVDAGEEERLCFDLDKIAPDASKATPAPLCFEREGMRWVAVGS